MSKFQQLKDGWCGPASLQYALNAQGIFLSQEKIASMTGTTLKNGVDPKGIKTFLKKIGIDYQELIGNDAFSIIKQLNEQIDSGKSAIVDYLDGSKLSWDGHYSVFKKSTGKNLNVWCPSYDKVRSFPKNKFFKKWKDTKKDGKLFRNWALVLSSRQEYHKQPLQ